MSFLFKKSYVFVVCGEKDHIETLNFALDALRQNTTLPILIVTDLSRNDRSINSPDNAIVNVKTPRELDNHQASIYLKTGLHKFLPMENALYCYLDSDVVAISGSVDLVFENFTKPISFCSDHCRMNEFSSSAVNCGCQNKPEELQSLLDEFANKYSNSEVIEKLLRSYRAYLLKHPFPRLRESWYNQFVNNDEELRIKRDRLIDLTSPKISWCRLIWNYLFKVLPNYKRSLTSKKWYDWKGNLLIDESERYFKFMNEHGFFLDEVHGRWLDRSGKPIMNGVMTFDEFFESHGLVLDKESRAWYTTKGDLFLVDITNEIESRTEFRYNSNSDTWYDKRGNPVFNRSCDHLKSQIQVDFNISIDQEDWQHWNGGVFLFSSASIGFMETWHNLTLEVFSKPYWKTRDQGTLIATVWKMGLQNQPLLPVEFNFIADYNHPTLLYNGDFTFFIRPNGALIKPHFIHIYHHWGDTSWAVWNDVAQRVHPH